jgi:uncharacterized protein with von Willebrand factor type A (vWA) domain
LDTASVRPLGGKRVATVLAHLVEQQLSTDRIRLLARYELSLEAVRRPALREVLAAGTQAVRDAVAARLAEDGIDHPHATADDVLVMLDGLMFAELTAADSQTRSRNELRRSIERVIGHG